ncbi:MAG: hypothetical protein ABS75_33570 [Pelagibacterium sp. SCN 63-23]|jgi:CRP-like cAMP-binding protein|nr:MAG: hypothetical protein ABS75_33570 [Pelagibacterium sp. SCN 63-23]
MEQKIFNAPTQLGPFFAKLGLRDELGPHELAALAAAAGEHLRFKPGDDIVREGDRPGTSILLTEGFACRYRLQDNGNRQIVAINLPGDFVDLHSFLLKEMDHSVGVLTECTAIAFPHSNLVRLTEQFPHLTRLLWLLTLIEGSSHREWLAGFGLLSAPQRTAHLLCEIYVRLEAIGLASGHSFAFPLTQTALADAVGISAVHVNRVLQELRQARLIDWARGIVTIHDWPGLVAAGKFNDNYLHLKQEQR